MDKPNGAGGEPAEYDLARAKVAVMDYAARCAARGWVPATSGNFSARIDEGWIACTRSGRDKGALSQDDVMPLNLEAPIYTGASAEAALHVQIYGAFPETQMVLHTHANRAVQASRAFAAEGKVVFEGLELLKALRGVTTHDTRVEVPIVPNDQDIPRMAEGLAPILNGETPVWGYLIEGHGFYTWGTSPEEAWRQLEAFDTLFDLVLSERV